MIIFIHLILHLILLGFTCAKPLENEKSVYALLWPDDNATYTTSKPTNSSSITTTTRTTPPPPLCSYNGYWLNCSNFDTFSQLSINFRNKTYREQELLIIRPIQKLDMDESFDLTGYDMKYSSLELANINSFLFSPNPTKNFNAKSLYLKESNLVFLQNGKSINSNCNNLTLSSPSFLNYIRQTVIFYKTNNFNEICPYLFKDVSIDLFTTQIPLKFLPIDPNVNLNVSMRALDLEENIFRLNKESFSPQVFGKITSMRMRLINLLGIDDEFFKSLPYLTYIKFDLLNMREFFQSNQNHSWMQSLNFIKLSKQLSVTLSDANSSYAFGDEDFCLFKDLPHSNSVYFQIDTKANLTCSCTIYWLFKNKMDLSYDISLDATKKCFTGNLLTERVKECEFEKRIEACNRKATTTTTTTTTTSTSITTVLSTTTQTPSTTKIVTDSLTTNTTNIPTTALKPTYQSYLINFICNNCNNLTIINNIKS